LLGWTRYGDGKGRPILLGATASYRKKVMALLESNMTHAAVVSAKETVAAMLAQALHHDTTTSTGYFQSRYQGSREMQRLARAGVTAEEVLVAVLGTWLYLKQEPRQRTDREVHFGLARAVVALAPSEKRTSWRSGRAKTWRERASPSDLNGLGRWFRENLASLSVLTSMGVEALEAEVAARRTAQRQPLKLPKVDGRGIRKTATYASLAFGTT
jgi:hypothetical protein